MTVKMEFTATEAQRLAFEFLMSEWSLSSDDQDWFTILSVRLTGDCWFIVEIGVEGLPDKWVIQVYDTGECDPNYTFYSPIAATEPYSDLLDFPVPIVEVLTAERIHNASLSL